MYAQELRTQASQYHQYLRVLHTTQISLLSSQVCLHSYPLTIYLSLQNTLSLKWKPNPSKQAHDCTK